MIGFLSIFVLWWCLLSDTDGRITLRAGSTFANLAWGDAKDSSAATAKAILVDMDNVSRSRIQTYKMQGKQVICYVSVGKPFSELLLLGTAEKEQKRAKKNIRFCFFFKF